MHLLLLEPYYGGSHRAFLKGLQKHLPFQFTLVSLPARKWKMRMQLAALWMAEEVVRLVREGANFDAVFCSTYLDLATFKVFSGRLKTINLWMIGRGALANPFLPSVITAGKDEITGKVEKFKYFYEDLFDQYRQVFSGPGHLLARMKGFWTYFSKSFQNSRKIEKKIHRTQKLQRYLEIVGRFFDEEAEWVD